MSASATRGGHKYRAGKRSRSSSLEQKDSLIKTELKRCNKIDRCWNRKEVSRGSPETALSRRPTSHKNTSRRVQWTEGLECVWLEDVVLLLFKNGSIVVRVQQVYIGVNFTALRRNWFLQRHFYFSIDYWTIYIVSQKRHWCCTL